MFVFVESYVGCLFGRWPIFRAGNCWSRRSRSTTSNVYDAGQTLKMGSFTSPFKASPLPHWCTVDGGVMEVLYNPKQRGGRRNSRPRGKPSLLVGREIRVSWKNFVKLVIHILNLVLLYYIYIVKLWRKIFVFYFKENSLLNLLDLHKLNSIPLYLFNNQLNKEILHIFLLYKEKDWTFIKCIMLTKLLIIQFNCMLVWQNKNT